ncbi:DUF3142 domain-containing protein [Sphingomonas piscis]|uniref:DUF3142 domain-containing protein n=1 Tax=Sphingomonas piscis TaxID=2714943 RepID=A0A6G7YNN6_9SPHN|nr:DUF3142 domain-containing protein [Sphingomonas piscis]QIK78336.1 DUF3142 domain-containing protein [Sphingomonas piscis]
MRRRLAVLALALLAAACGDRFPGRVDARDHEAFWLWAGVAPQPVLAKATTLYILDGEVRTGAGPAYVSLRSQAPRLTRPEVWMVVRTDDLRWREESYAAMLTRLEQWRASNRLAGLQIDFDARTRHLGDYALFLSDLRRRLPPGLKLSITGLLDWSANGEPRALEQLGGTVDDIVLQTYQSRTTIRGYEDYVRKLDGLRVPFKIGLVQGGEWREPARLRRNPKFHGYVVFLLNPR